MKRGGKKKRGWILGARLEVLKKKKKEGRVGVSKKKRGGPF